jgi:putative DNA primase/helicase
MPVVTKPKKPAITEPVISDIADGAQPGNVITFPATQEPHNPVSLTEDDVAEDFADRYGQDLRFDHDRGKWFQWNGNGWASNNTGLAFDFARRLCREHRGEKVTMASKKAAEAVEHMARRDQRLAVTSSIWDHDPYLLGTPGGTLELKTGLLRPANRQDFITKRVIVTPADPGTDCPIFKKFLAEATAGDEGLQRFLQQWVGYGLTGDTSEQALVFVYGPGGNGKGVFLGVVTEIMADYAKTAAMETFVASKHQRHLTELAMLHGARVVTASETEKNQSWSESRINQLTGEDPITANFMRQDHFTFRPSFKLTLIGNHKPKLGAVTEAARRRFNIVPFEHKPKVPDKTLKTKLRAEYPAILRWMVEGCLDWQKNGLVRPEIVTATTAQYFEEQDLIGRWIDEKCECAPGVKDSASNLFASWKEFALANGEGPETMTVFSSLLHQRGFQKKKSGAIQYIGIKVKTQQTVQFHSKNLTAI